ncbi:RsmB/NOP family class I SAM-dependent RNA methyltransferase [Deferribacterales bacterium Es71-Z0220]|uniref:RsmB/NOP family class I SAM-dependent RNA methyltransferase n=1 Tax=Deferrivibrio essentukiensis TaxID=2880922 RepID=UPI001F61AC18|nr:RsmB/NOP family class I SAM-dependent RNA methyltransferase [Deferrivibrio essentukiensis]MCB4203976.1 RsmB/NOP family class I SAM-dependent RNA methyltransferase [Deferrivibrio essentukiensis]
MKLPDNIYTQVNTLICKTVTENLIAKNVLDDYIREKRFNSTIRNALTDYFFKALRFYGLFSSGHDIENDETITELIAKTKYNENFPSKIIGVNNFVSKKIFENLDKDTFLSFLQRAPLTIRVNSLKTTREYLKVKYPFFENTGISPFGLYTTKHTNLRQLDEFKKGFFEIQDEASQLIYFLVNPKHSEKILDMCAGTGGKTLSLLSTGLSPDIYAYDISFNRLKVLEKRVRLNKFNIKLLKKLSGRYNKVLIDAPCSGSGSIRRDVDVLLRLNEEKLNNFIANQRELFDKAYHLTEKGGFVIYVTCSFFKEENEKQVEYFLNNYNIKLVEVSTLFDNHMKKSLQAKTYYKTNPLLSNMDGFFGAVFKIL